MGIYLGDSGRVFLGRDESHERYHGVIRGGDPDTGETGDVNPDRRRLSVLDAASTIITGDYIQIYTLPIPLDDDASTLVRPVLKSVYGNDATEYPDWTGYVHMDAVGGMRLYERFQDAVVGAQETALPLYVADENQEVIIKSATTRSDACLARVQSYDLTTSRELIDITVLGEQFRNQYEAGLISGQGTLRCIWEHSYVLCEDGIYEDDQVEFPVYLAKLCIRLNQGARFRGKFYLYQAPEDSSENSVWYEANCIVNNVTINVNTQSFIQSSIQFVTTGPVTLVTDEISDADLLLQDGNLLTQEDGSRILLP